MQKNNQKGFMLVEAFIVSTIVLTVLVFMFVQIRTVINGYNRSFSYNTIPGIYIANELSEFVSNFDYENIKSLVVENGYVIKGENGYQEYDLSVNYTWNEMLKSANVKNVIISDESIERLKNSTDPIVSAKLKNYIKTLKIGDLFGVYRIIIEFNDGTYASVKMA